jgi:hypothetical protein
MTMAGRWLLPCRSLTPRSMADSVAARGAPSENLSVNHSVRAAL